MKRCSEYKNEALQALKGNWGNTVVATLIYLVATMVISESSSFYSLISRIDPLSVPSTPLIWGITGIVIVASLFVLGPLGGGYTNAAKKLIESKGTDNDLIDNMFKIGFGRNYLRFVLMVVLTEVIAFVLMGLFLSPVFFILSPVTKLILTAISMTVFLVFIIIISLMLALTPFLIVDEPQLSVVEAMVRSCRMMTGMKWRLFVLQLSFLGWILLSLLTLGIGLLWVIPYYQTSVCAFYYNLKEEQQAA